MSWEDRIVSSQLRTATGIETKHSFTSQVKRLTKQSCIMIINNVIVTFN